MGRTLISGQPTNIRHINQLRILNALRQQHGLSRVAISRQTGLGKATISTLVADFIDNGLVREVGRGVQFASAGRRPVKLELSSEAYLAVGIELTGHECVAALTDLYAQPLRTLRWSMSGTSVESSLQTIERAIATLLDGYAATKLWGVAVGIPGVVDSVRQRVIMAENLGWTDVPFGKLLQEQIGLPVSVINRTNAGALGEYWYGAGSGINNLVYVSIGVGIGAGIIIDGKLYEGVNGSAGEIGHITIDPAGHRCTCGNRGCLETLASSTAVVVRVKERIRQDNSSILNDWTNGNLELITVEMICSAAASGDNLAITVIQEAADYLGIAIANTIDLFNPALIIIDGDLLELGDAFLEPIRQTVNRRAFSIPLAAVRIVPSPLRHLASAIGASTLVLDAFFAAAPGLFADGNL